MRLPRRMWRAGMCAGALALVVGALREAPVVPAEGGNPVGLWQAFDSKSGRPNTLIRIWEENGRPFGGTE